MTHNVLPRLRVQRRRWERAYLVAAAMTAAPWVPSLAFAQPATEPTTPAPSAPTAEPAPTTETPPVSLPPMTPAASESPPRKDDVDGTERTLKRHVLIFPAFIRSSVVTTYFGQRLRLGANTATNVATAAGLSEVDVVTLDEGFDLGIKVTDWFGLYVTTGVRALIGTNLKALTYAGATYDVGAGGGVIFRLFRSDDGGTQLSLRAQAAIARGQVSTLYPIFDKPVLSAVELLQGDLDQSIKTPFTTTTYEGALAFAQSFGRFFALQASGGAGGGSVSSEPYDRVRKVRNTQTVSQVTYTLGIAPSFDFASLRVPIAVMPEYLLSRQASDATVRGSGDFDTTHTLALGVYYSGRVNLQVGLIASTMLGINPLITPNGKSDAPRRDSSTFVLRYVW